MVGWFGGRAHRAARSSMLLTVGLAVLVVGAEPAAPKPKPKPKVTVKAKPIAVVALTEDQLRQGLLTPTDLPSDWVVPSQARDAHRPGFCNGPNAPDRATAAGATASASIVYAGDPNLGPALTEDLYAFPTATQAAQFVDATATTANACTSYTLPAGDGSPSETARILPLGLAKSGDQSISFRQTISRPQTLTSGQTVDVNVGNVDVVYFRSGNVVAGVGFVSGDIGVSTLRIFVAKSLRQVESARRDAARPSGPSGGAHAPPTIASAAACRAVVDGLAPPPDPPSIQDPIALIHTNTYAPLPLETVPQEVTQFNSYFTADMYLDGTPVPDPTVWRNAMNADHFVDAIAAGYRNSNGATFGAEAFKFGSAAMAADFQRQTLDAACNGGHASRMASIDRLPGAVVYESTDSGVSPYRASAVVGPYVLHFYLCGCVGGHDLLGRARLWARSAASEIGVTPS